MRGSIAVKRRPSPGPKKQQNNPLSMQMNRYVSPKSVSVSLTLPSLLCLSPGASTDSFNDVVFEGENDWTLLNLITL